MFRALWERLYPPRQPDFPPGGYRVFTTQHDAEVGGSDLVMPGRPRPTDVDAYRGYFATWRESARLAATASLERIVAACGDRPLGDAVVSLLIDHSGSMRGRRAMLTIALAEFLTEHLQHLGASVEVLGYTTQSWRGGESWRAWTRAGRPKNPGRLCDLLHIVYRTAADTNPGLDDSIRNMLRGEVLKENIDGEAVLWAAGRLRACPRQHKILIPICDGAPVDDATLMANTPDYLDRHMRSVMTTLATAGDIEMLGIGIHYDLTRYYARFVRVATMADYAEHVLPFLEAAILEPPAPG